jgi:hypothetical protein
MTVTSSDRLYFQRVATQNRVISRGQAPTSLQEAFDRLAAIEADLGPWLSGSRFAPGSGDLKSHLTYLQRLRTIDS